MGCVRCRKDRSIKARGLCNSCYERSRLLNDPGLMERKREYLKQYQIKNRERLSEYYKSRELERQKNPVYKAERRDAYYRKKYGLSAKEVDKAKRGSCGICRKRKTTMHTDHCHATGRVRGFLCSKCNNGLGFFDDNPGLLRKALEYLIAGKRVHSDRNAQLAERAALLAGDEQPAATLE